MNGNDAWPAYEQGVKPGSMVYDAPMEGNKDESRYVATEESEQTGRKYILEQLLRDSLFDKLNDAWGMFM